MITGTCTSLDTDSHDTSADAVSEAEQKFDPKEFKKDGDITLGFVDSEMYFGRVIWTKVLYPMYWEIKVESISVEVDGG